MGTSFSRVAPHLFVISLVRARIFVSRPQYNFLIGDKAAHVCDVMTRPGCTRDTFFPLLNWWIFHVPPKATKMSALGRLFEFIRD